MAKSDAVLARLLRLHPKKIDLSLGRILTLLSRLGDPHEKLPPVVHVAGTNGKGSSIAFMRAMLEAAVALEGAATREAAEAAFTMEAISLQREGGYGLRVRATRA